MNEQSQILAPDLRSERSWVSTWTDHLNPIFLGALLLSTWLPMAFFLLSSKIDNSIFGFGAMKTVLLFLGTAHVPATIFFYMDRDFSHIIKEHKFRYIYFPIALTITTGALFAFAGTMVQAYILLAYWAWQAFHYGRQNTGIYSFAAIATRGTPADKQEKIIIDLGTWCGILGTFKILGMGIAPNYLRAPFDSLYGFGSVAFVGVVVASIVVYLRHFKRTTPLLTIFYFTLVCFFLPVFLSTNLNVAFFSYAIAHGVQYILFMTVVSLNFDPQAVKRWKIASAAKLFMVIGLVGFLFYRAGELKTIEFFTAHATLLRVVDFAIGAILGATMAHFVIDAGAWKLSQSLQRRYIGKRFGFVFANRRLEDRVTGLQD
ncbi:MAG TPA: hypothetical protein VKA78_05530 [Pyrinomonadaceae bacterium]|nr:hypothetical protein [Pyrinomonadaceae bacterium]